MTHVIFYTCLTIGVCAGKCTYHRTHQMEKTVGWAKGGVKKGIKPLWPLPGFSGQMNIKIQMSQNVRNSGCTIWICGDIKTCLVYFVLYENYFHWSCGTWIKMNLALVFSYNKLQVFSQQLYWKKILTHVYSQVFLYN